MKVLVKSDEFIIYSHTEQLQLKEIDPRKTRLEKITAHTVCTNQD